jgi:hypothetical protein
MQIKASIPVERMLGTTSNAYLLLSSLKSTSTPVGPRVCLFFSLLFFVVYGDRSDPLIIHLLLAALSPSIDSTSALISGICLYRFSRSIEGAFLGSRTPASINAISLNDERISISLESRHEASAVLLNASEQLVLVKTKVDKQDAVHHPYSILRAYGPFWCFWRRTPCSSGRLALVKTATLTPAARANP